MAEFVELRTEEWMHELERLEKLRLFEKREFKAICKKRKDLEYKIQRLSKRKDDYMQYIQYEMDLLKLVRLRKKKLDIPVQISDIECAIARHIHKLYSQALIRFKDDINIYVAYIKFCNDTGDFGLVTSIFNHMLKVHSVKPSAWQFAARWALEKYNSKDTARDYLLQGIHYNPDSQMLYKEAFRLELMHAETKKKQKEKSEVYSGRNFQIEQSDNFERPSSTVSIERPSEQSNALEQEPFVSSAGKIPKRDELSNQALKVHLVEALYESASKKIHDIKFYIELLEIAKEFNSNRNFQQKLASNLLERFQTDERAWDVFARLLLEDLVCLQCFPSELDFPMSRYNSEVCEEKDTSSVNKINLKDRINYCCAVYSRAVQELPTQRMWSMYIETLLELNQDLAHLPKFKKKLLANALQSAHTAGLLQEKYYLQWTRLSQQKSKIDSILHCATSRFPLSIELWLKRLQLHLSEDEKSGALVFQEAISAFGNDSKATLPLWKMYIQYWQTKSTAKVEEIFLEGIDKDNAIACHLKPMFIEWLVLVKGIATARKMYDSISIIPPFCLEIHHKIISLECMQPEFNLKQTRKCFDLACRQFGKENPNIWMDYIKFEKKRGDPKKMTSLKLRALEHLSSVHTAAFISEFCLVKSTASEES